MICLNVLTDGVGRNGESHMKPATNDYMRLKEAR